MPPAVVPLEPGKSPTPDSKKAAAAASRRGGRCASRIQTQSYEYLLRTILVLRRPSMNMPGNWRIHKMYESGVRLVVIVRAMPRAQTVQCVVQTLRVTGWLREGRGLGGKAGQ